MQSQKTMLFIRALKFSSQSIKILTKFSW